MRWVLGRGWGVEMRLALFFFERFCDVMFENGGIGGAERLLMS